MAYSFEKSKDTKEVAVINAHLIKKQDVILIRETIAECIEEYRPSLELAKDPEFYLEYVEISKRMAVAAGTCYVNYAIPRSYNIKLAHNNYLEFGTESMLKTLRHEMAHLIEVQLHGTTGHSERFKRICVRLGGHMNTQIAGQKYKDNATTEYCKRKDKYVFGRKCTCGMIFKSLKAFTVKELISTKCKICGTMMKDMEAHKWTL